jgi:hypothetical protein
MRRTLFLLALLAVAALALPASAPAASTYCSPSGDLCYSAQRIHGIIRLRLDSFAHTGRVQVCVRGPNRRLDCRRFRLRTTRSGLQGMNARWSRHFPNYGLGTYRVRFRQGYSLGPAITFRRG